MKNNLEVTRRHFCAALLATGAPTAWSQTPAASATAVPARQWMRVPRASGRLTAADIGLVVNTADAYSVEVGTAYVQARHLTPSQVLHVELPLRPVLQREEFTVLSDRIGAHFGVSIQALALAWRTPFAVDCNSITGALALGFDANLCRNSCSVSRRSRYFASPSVRPFADLGMRPAMLLAAPDTAAALRLIERGVAADGSLGRRGAPMSTAHFLVTDDARRNVRVPAYPPPGRLQPMNVDVRIDETSALFGADRVLLYQLGRVQVEHLDSVRFVPGALADHLTSTGGAIDGSTPQMSALDWIAAGATATHGTVSEPCARPEKFPHPQVLLLSYLQGSTAIEAYWRSVACPQQSLFIGEPLAAPFARD